MPTLPKKVKVPGKAGIIRNLSEHLDFLEDSPMIYQRRPDLDR